MFICSAGADIVLFPEILLLSRSRKAIHINRHDQGLNDAKVSLHPRVDETESGRYMVGDKQGGQAVYTVKDT